MAATTFSHHFESLDIDDWHDEGKILGEGKKMAVVHHDEELKTFYHRGELMQT